MGRKHGVRGSCSAIVSALFLFCVGSGFSQSIPSFAFSFQQPFGKYAVGLRVVQQYDASRPFSATGIGKAPQVSSSGRPLQTLIWYPAVRGQGAPMTLGDYERLISHETRFEGPAQDGVSQGFVHAFMAGTENGNTVSFENATAVGHRFPVVIYAPSLDAPNMENIELCEYLASYGFVVLASPSMGASVRHMTVSPADAAAQAADILFLLRFAKSLKDVRKQEAGVIGYSWGGTGALLAASEDSEIRALVALDGSFRYAPVPSIKPATFRIPLLFFSRGETPIVLQDDDASAQAENTRILREWTHGDLFQVRMLAISHIQFSSLFQRSARFKREGMQFVPKGYTLEDGDESYGWIARYTMKFLKAYLQHDRKAKAYLLRSPAENGVPKRLMQMSFRPAMQ